MRRKKKITREQKMSTNATRSSKYALKRQWLDSHPQRVAAGRDSSGRALLISRTLFGFQVAAPKPWRR